MNEAHRSTVPQIEVTFGPTATPRSLQRLGSVFHDDSTPTDATRLVGDDPETNFPERLPSSPRGTACAEIQELRDVRRNFGHLGSGFGPVAVTRRCGTQSSTWLKPSKHTPSSSTTSKKERR
jgi:hypothetical protein